MRTRVSLPDKSVTCCNYFNQAKSLTDEIKSDNNENIYTPF